MTKNNFFMICMILASVWMILDLAEGGRVTKEIDHVVVSNVHADVPLPTTTIQTPTVIEVKKPTPALPAPKPVAQPAKKPAIEAVKITPPPADPKRITKSKFRKHGVWYFWPEDPKQDLINYAYKKGGRDFLLTLNGENGIWQWDKKSDMVGSNGYSDYWLCQLNGQYHAKFIFANGANSKDGWGKDFQDPYKQVDYCFEVFHDAIKKGMIFTTFYAYRNREGGASWFQNLK